MNGKVVSGDGGGSDGDQDKDCPFDPEAAPLLDDRYRLLDEVGSGGFGTVYRALQISTGQRVAIKLLRTDQGNTPSLRRAARFRREMELCARLNHPHVVQLLDSGQVGDQLYTVFEYIEGDTLASFIRRYGALSSVLATDIMMQVLDGLIAAHAHGIVHRDLKPENIMLIGTGANQSVKVLDFGVGAFVQTGGHGSHQTLTLTQETIGTPAYAAPEQLRGEAPGQETDLYPWGLIYLECLTGERVIRSTSLPETLYQHLSDKEIPLPPAVARHPLGTLLRKALRKARTQRSQDASSLRSELRSLHVANLVMENTARIDEVSNAGPGLRRDKLRVTALCTELQVKASGGVEPDLEALQTIATDQLELCREQLSAHGGHAGPILGNCAITYFGFPLATDADAVRAARAALALTQRAAERSARLETQQGIRLDLRIGLHTGWLLTTGNEPVTGLTDAAATRLALASDAGRITVSDDTARRLVQQMELEPGPVGARSVHGTDKAWTLLGELSVELSQRHSDGSALIPIVGRDGELQTLKDDWKAAESGEGRMVLMYGDPGIGKSRVVEELSRHVVERGGATRVAGCLMETQKNALKPILDMLARQFGLDSALGPEQATQRLVDNLSQLSVDLPMAVPIFCTWYGLGLPVGYAALPHSPQLQQAYLVSTLAAILASPSNATPNLVVIEDLHWADPITLELLAMLPERLTTTATLLVVTARPEFEWSGPPNHVDRRTLETLPVVSIEAIVSALAGGVSVHPDVVDLVARRSDGVPLFVQELTREILETNSIVRDDEYVLDVTVLSDVIPASLNELLASRIHRLGSVKETAEVAAAIGREFERSLLETVLGDDASKVATDLLALVDADLIYRRMRVDQEVYVFRHALIRDAAYDGMLKARREAIHCGIAEELEVRPREIGEQDPGVLAHHWGSGGKLDKAIDYALEAAARALARSNTGETLSFADSALRWLNEASVSDAADKELAINRVLTPALMSTEGWAGKRVRDTVERSQNLVAQNRKSPHSYTTLCSLVFYHHMASNRAETRALVNRMLQEFAVSSDLGARVLALTLAGQATFIDGDYELSHTYICEAIDKYQPEQHAEHGLTLGMDTRVWAATTLGQLDWFLGNHPDPLEHLHCAVAWAERLDLMPTLGVAYLFEAVVQSLREDLEAADIAARRSIALAEEFGLPAVEGYARIISHWANDEPDSIQPFLARLRSMGCRIALTRYGSLPADCEYRRGNYTAALLGYDASLRDCGQQHEHYYEPELLRKRALAALHAGRARTEVEDGLRTAAANAAKRGMYRSQACAILDRWRHFGPEATPSLSLMQVVRDHPFCMTQHDRQEAVSLGALEAG
ncbi:MAG: TOMM system kinase/cyclase fusion protein [Pseudomonadota bacterium]